MQSVGSTHREVVAPPMPSKSIFTTMRRGTSLMSKRPWPHDSGRASQPPSWASKPQKEAFHGLPMKRTSWSPLNSEAPAYHAKSPSATGLSGLVRADHVSSRRFLAHQRCRTKHRGNGMHRHRCHRSARSRRGCFAQPVEIPSSSVAFTGGASDQGPANPVPPFIMPPKLPGR